MNHNKFLKEVDAMSHVEENNTEKKVDLVSDVVSSNAMQKESPIYVAGDFDNEKIDTIVDDEGFEDDKKEGDDDCYATEEGLALMADNQIDEFGAIDLIIPTPESIADAERECQEAKEELDKARVLLEEKEEAYRKAELKKKFLITGRISKSDVVVACHTDSPRPEEVTCCHENSMVEDNSDSKSSDNSLLETEHHVELNEEKSEALDSIKHNEEKLDDEEVKSDTLNHQHKDKKKTFLIKRLLWYTLALIIIGGIAFFVYNYLIVNNNGVGENAIVTLSKSEKSETINPTKGETVLPNVGDSLDIKQEQAVQENSDSVVSSQHADSIKKTQDVSDEDADTPRPKTYVMKKGQTLTNVSLQFYGTKDSVKAIIRHNSFKDPDNVFAGAVIKLP